MTNHNKILILFFCALNISCSSTIKRDQKLIEALKIQNSVIDVLKYDRVKMETKRTLANEPSLQFSENSLLRGLNQIKKSNLVVISKLKPKTNGVCGCGKNERTNDSKKRTCRAKNR